MVVSYEYPAPRDEVWQEVNTSCSLGCITPENKAVCGFWSAALLGLLLKLMIEPLYVI